jgi:hypothetical protein
MAGVAQLSKSVAKVALATVFTGPLAGAREAGIQALEIASNRSGGSAEKQVLDQVSKQVDAIATGQGIEASDARNALETAEDIFRCHALTLKELTGLHYNPERAAVELFHRGNRELRNLSEAAEGLCRRTIESTYRGLLAHPALLPGLERRVAPGSFTPRPPQNRA